MTQVREASESDGDALALLFLEAPLEAGTAFVFDRRPDFFALLRMRGESRTFVAVKQGRIVGAATALWHDVRDGDCVVRVGEVVDLRVARGERGSTVAWRLLGAVREAFEAANVQWISCLIGDRNSVTTPMIQARAGFPRLNALSRYASVHYIAWRAPRSGARRVTVRRAASGDHAKVRQLFAPARAAQRWVPVDGPDWPDCEIPARAWIAEQRSPDNLPLGALLLWDPEAVRRLRVVRYAGGDRFLRALTVLAAGLGIAARLPSPGRVLSLWGSRAFAVRDARADVVRALVHAALRDAAAAGQHVVQINLEKRDPLLAGLPIGARSIFWSTLYGAPFGKLRSDSTNAEGLYHCDVALS